MANSKQTGYCDACFKNFKDCRLLDEDGNCRIHGGGFGQTFDVSKTKQTMLGIGLAGAALAFLFGRNTEKSE
jgi:hypothetical protein